MEFAPIIIPTLCRHNHLANLLNSLSTSSLADKTEVFISVDGLPSEKYAENRIILCKMLDQYDFSAFKDVHIFYQKKNIGSAANMQFLIDEVSKKFTKYIFSEDDNIFSQNFLEYMNWGLDYFKNDENVISINSCNNYDALAQSEKYNILLSKMYVPYGIGKWVKKDSTENIKCSKYLLDRKNWTIKNLFSLYKKNPILCQIYLRQILFVNEGFFYLKKDCLWCCDTVMTIYLHLTNCYCILPIISKSLTKGNDGSGTMAVNKLLVEPILDNKHSFNSLNSCDLQFNNKNNKRAYKHLRTIIKPQRLLTFFYIIIMMVKGKNREKMISWNNRFNKLIKRIRRGK